MKVAEETEAAIDAECPFESLTVIVALPPLTGVTVKVALVSSRRRAPDELVELAAATVITLVFEDAALNEPSYPASLTVNVCGRDDENENDETDGETVPEPAAGNVWTDAHPVTNRNADRHGDKTKRRLIKKRPSLIKDRR